jgi:serine/threonine protein phosphatase PrpC
LSNTKESRSAYVCHKENLFEAYSFTIQNKKEDQYHNGDSVLIDFWEEEHIVLLALADGVGSTNCHWDASKLACEYSIKLFKEAFISNRRIDCCISEAINQTNKKIIDEATGSCSGMLTTLVFVAWNISNNNYWFSSLGDSRLYRLSGRELNQISIDQKTSEIIYMNGKPFIQNGTVVYRNLITNALGKNAAEIEVESDEFDPGESLILATDGCYESHPNFKILISDLLAEPDLKKSFNSFRQSTDGKNYDDASMILLRRNDFIEEVPAHLEAIGEIKVIADALNNNRLDEALSALKTLLEKEIKIGIDNYDRLMKVFQSSSLSDNSEIWLLLRKLASKV